MIFDLELEVSPYSKPVSGRGFEFLWLVVFAITLKTTAALPDKQPRKSSDETEIKINKISHVTASSGWYDINTRLTLVRFINILGSQLAKILITTSSTTAQGSTCPSRGRKTMLQELSYPPDFSSPRHYDCVGDGGGQADERGDVDGAAGPFWFNSILSWGQISLQTQSRTNHF